MIRAVNDNDWSAVRGFIEDMIPKNSAEHTQLEQIHAHSNIIIESCSRRFIELLSFFLNNGLPVDYIVDENNETMLHLAASEGYLPLVDLLLNSGANIDGMSKDGETPLYKAVCKNHLGVAKHLISAGADISKYGEMVLHEAVWSNNVTAEMLQLLLDSGCNPNVQSHLYSPLYLAVMHKNIKVAQMLLDAGAHVNGTDAHVSLHQAAYLCYDANIPLHQAAYDGYIPIVKFLLEYGADVNAREFLKEHGSQININRVTPLSISIRNFHFHVAMLLINCGADLELDAHRELLCIAVRLRAPVELIECLLDHGARVNTVYVQLTALQFVIFHSHYCSDKKLHIAKLLLIYGSDHYIEDNHGNTLLHWACEMEDTELVEYLIDYGLNVDAKNNEGKKPFDIATEKGYNNIVKVIIHYHCNKYIQF